jgi:cytochrome P450
MDATPAPFVPPAPKPRTGIPGYVEIVRTLYRNPLEIWGEPSFNERWIRTRFINERTLIVNDPGLIRHVLVDNARNYRMATIRQLILRPILRDGLLTAEGDTWKRSRRAMAPVFTPRRIGALAETMLERSHAFLSRFREGETRDIAIDMTDLTFDLLSETLFSGDIVTSGTSFAEEVNRLLETMGRVDPLDLLKAPKWLPRLTRIRGRRSLAFFRGIVADTIDRRRARMLAGEAVPDDLLTQLLRQEGEGGLSAGEIEDNIVTFIGAGHETTARALAWTLYCLANAPHERDKVEAEADRMASEAPPAQDWLEHMPHARAAFEEAMRLYPPAPSINRAAIADDRWNEVEIPAGITVLVMPWTLHRHRRLWPDPDAFMPERFLPANRDAIDRFQYLPFGAGPRVCIGAAFALQEAVIALGVLMSRLRFDCTAETRPWPVQRLTTQPEGGMPMRVSFRRTAQ